MHSLIDPCPATRPALSALGLLLAGLALQPVQGATLWEGDASARVSTTASAAYRPPGASSDVSSYDWDSPSRVESDAATGVSTSSSSTTGLAGSPLTSTASYASGSSSGGLAGVSASVAVNTAGGIQNSGSGTAEAIADWSDAVVIDSPGRTGQSGYLNASLILDGNLFVQAFGQDAHNFESAFATLSIIGEGLTAASGQVPAGQCLSGAGYCAYAFAGASTISGSPDNGYYAFGSLDVVIPFTFGQEFYISYTLKAKATAQAISWDQFAVQGAATGLASYANTLSWGGIDQITSGGIVVGDFSLDSGSGVDYREAVTAVPLPATHFLLISGLAALGAYRQRKARR
jgi:hypothetical protein